MTIPVPDHKRYFIEKLGLSERLMERCLGEALSAGGDYADLYFESVTSTSLGIAESLVKSATQRITLGSAPPAPSTAPSPSPALTHLSPPRPHPPKQAPAAPAEAPAEAAVASPSTSSKATSPPSTSPAKPPAPPSSSSAPSRRLPARWRSSSAPAGPASCSTRP